ncbi:MAG: hypothetical protein V8Q43_00850 [Christensenellaceae bacterium]
MESCAYAEVIVDIAHSNIDRIFDYKIDGRLEIPPGSRVRVPFGRAVYRGDRVARANRRRRSRWKKYARLANAWTSARS